VLWRRSAASIFYFLGGAAAATGICIGAYLLIPSNNEDAIHPPARKTKKEGALEAKAWMDQRLLSIWEELGIRTDDLRSASVQHLEWQLHPWQMEILEVSLPRDLSSQTVVDAIDELARRVGPLIRVSWLREKEGPWIGDVWVGGYLTHRIIIKEALQRVSSPKLALIVDDLGNFYRPIKPLLDLPYPLTLSILPKRPFSSQIAREASSKGKEIMVHIPMEPWDYPQKDPGPGALMTSMDLAQIKKVLEEDLSELNTARGANNHMGSRFTEEVAPMKAVLSVLALRGLYFVDSLTSPKSVAYEVAQKNRLRAYRRDVFLDVKEEEGFILSQFQKLLRISRLKGRAIAIVHPYEKTIEMLPGLMEDAKRRGFQWVKISQLDGPQGASQ
jgi:polysaccharide deacetylase 2 family uncharacterized protein YibQ